MFCKYCGTEMPDEAAFCPKCGQPTAGANSSMGDVGQPSGNTGTAPEGGAGQPQGGFAPRVNPVTEIGKSSLTLALTILFTVEVVFTLIAASLSVLNVLAIIVDIVVCVGCWMVYGSSSQNGDSTSGFSVLRIGLPIYLAIQVIALIATLVSMSRWMFGVTWVLWLIVELVEILLTCWCFYGLWVTTNDGWRILKGESVKWNVTTSCFVLFIILTVLAVVGVIFNMVYFSVAAMLSNLVSAAVYIVAAVILYRIREQA